MRSVPNILLVLDSEPVITSLPTGPSFQVVTHVGGPAPEQAGLPHFQGVHVLPQDLSGAHTEQGGPKAVA